MRKPIIAGNWKMFKTVPEATAFIEKLKSLPATDGVDQVICAPFTNLPAIVELTKGTHIEIGAQNMHWETQGAYTGEVSGAMLQNIGVRYVIIGHSERRAYNNETDEDVNKKAHAAFANDLIPIICVGEHLEEREAGKTKEVCKVQVEAALKGLTEAQLKNTVIAYEPIWAIGTGKSSTAEDANEVIAYIRELVAANFGQEAASNIRIQYGGSVKPENVAEYLGQSDIDGALVGGASLEASSYAALVEGAKQANE